MASPFLRQVSPPVSQPKGDLVLQVVIRRNVGDATRAFAVTDAFLSACKELNAQLLPDAPVEVRTVLVLDDVEAGSVTTWFRYALRSDKPARHDTEHADVCAYLASATTATLSWLSQGDAATSLEELASQVARLAERAGEDSAGTPNVAPRLTQAVGAFHTAVECLLPGDRALLLSAGAEVELNTSRRLTTGQVKGLGTSALLSSSAEALLIVEAPDYSQTNAWRFRHGSNSFSARISDRGWLHRFASRKLDVRPGDALRAILEVEVAYDCCHEVVRQDYTVQSVVELIARQTPTREDMQDNRG